MNQPLANSLLWWFSRFRPSTYRGNILAHGTQSGDSFNCGIVAYNAIAHDVFGDELWTMETRKLLRIESFSAIVLWHNGQVNTSTFLGKHGLTKLANREEIAQQADKDSKFRLILIELRIHRLARLRSRERASLR